MQDREQSPGDDRRVRWRLALGIESESAITRSDRLWRGHAGFRPEYEPHLVSYP